MRVLTGGGSGVRVFAGQDPRFGNLVMKHGGYRDTKELFALATIAQELRRRQRYDKTGNATDGADNLEPSQDMLGRLPAFKMMYISPFHLKDKPKDLWRALYKAATSIRFRNDSVDSGGSWISNFGSSSGGFSSTGTTTTSSSTHSTSHTSDAAGGNIQEGGGAGGVDDDDDDDHHHDDDDDDGAMNNDDDNNNEKK